MDYKKMWQFFDRKVLLTLNRYDQAREELKRVGMSDVIKFNAIPSIGPHQSFNLSQKQILKDFIASDNNVLLALEDDVQFIDLNPLASAIDDLKVISTWDIFYLGANIQDPKPRRITNSLFKIKGAWTTHAIAYTKKAARKIIENFPNESELMYDSYLSQLLPIFNTYIVSPMVAIQRPGYSDIWKQQVDYTEIFQASNNKLR